VPIITDRPVLESVIWISNHPKRASWKLLAVVSVCLWFLPAYGHYNSLLDSPQALI